MDKFTKPSIVVLLLAFLIVAVLVYAFLTKPAIAPSEIEELTPGDSVEEIGIDLETLDADLNALDLELDGLELDIQSLEEEL